MLLGLAASTPGPASWSGTYQVDQVGSEICLSLLQLNIVNYSGKTIEMKPEKQRVFWVCALCAILTVLTLPRLAKKAKLWIRDQSQHLTDPELVTEKPTVWIEKTHRKERAGLETELLFWVSGMREESCLLQYLWPKSKVSKLLLNLSELAGFHPSFDSQILLISRMTET